MVIWLYGYMVKIAIGVLLRGCSINFILIKYAKDEDEKKLTALYHGKRKK